MLRIDACSIFDAKRRGCVMHRHAPRSWQAQPQDIPGRETHRLSAFVVSRNIEETIQVPVHVVPVEKAPLASLPIRMRHVFLLSNGQRTPQDIAHMLRLPLDEVERFIQILHKRHLTTWYQEHPKGACKPAQATFPSRSH